MRIYGRVLGFIISVLIATVIAVSITVIPFAVKDISNLDHIMQNEWVMTIGDFVQEIVTIGIVILFWTKVNKRKVSVIGLRDVQSKKRFAKGVLFGFLSMTVIFLILFLSGSVHAAKGNSDLPKIFIGLFLMFFVGFTEEFMFRGYILNTLLEKRPKWEAVVVSSVIFGLFHLGNDNVSMLGVLNIFLVGILFSLMYLKTGSLWLGIGFHFMWDFAESYLYGFADSGNVTSGFLKSVPVKLPLLTGVGFGPEGGLICTLVIVVSILFFLRKKVA